MSRLPLMVFLIMAPAGLLQAQVPEPSVTMTISPRPDRLEIGISKVTLAATVRRKTGPVTYRVLVRCGKDVCHESPALQVPPGSGDYGMAFGVFTVQSSVAPGTEVCAHLQSLRHVNKLSGPYEYSTDAEQCRTALRPAAATLAGAAPASGAGKPKLTNLPAVRAEVRPQARAEARAAPGSLRLPASTLPDLVVEYEATPVARWLVKNLGPSPSPSTSLRMTRVNAGEQVLTVPPIKANSFFEIEVTPELDQYLVNSSAFVDPDGIVKELNEDNNEWQSAWSR